MSKSQGRWRRKVIHKNTEFRVTKESEERQLGRPRKSWNINITMGLREIYWRGGAQFFWCSAWVNTMANTTKFIKLKNKQDTKIYWISLHLAQFKFCSAQWTDLFKTFHISILPPLRLCRPRWHSPYSSHGSPHGVQAGLEPIQSPNQRYQKERSTHS
jgi:hypothetical protein